MHQTWERINEIVRSPPLSLPRSSFSLSLTHTFLRLSSLSMFISIFLSLFISFFLSLFIFTFLPFIFTFLSMFIHLFMFCLSTVGSFGSKAIFYLYVFITMFLLFLSLHNSISFCVPLYQGSRLSSLPSTFAFIVYCFLFLLLPFFYTFPPSIPLSLKPTCASLPPPARLSCKSKANKLLMASVDLRS